LREWFRKWSVRRLAIPGVAGRTGRVSREASGPVVLHPLLSRGSREGRVKTGEATRVKGVVEKDHDQARCPSHPTEKCVSLPSVVVAVVLVFVLVGGVRA